MDEKLKPCPFCGCNKVTGEHLNEYFDDGEMQINYYILCPACGTITGHADKDEEPTIAAWNRRN